MLPIIYILDCHNCGGEETLVCYDTTGRVADYDSILDDNIRGRSISFFKCSTCGNVVRGINWDFTAIKPMPIPMTKEQFEELDKLIKKVFSNG